MYVELDELMLVFWRMVWVALASQRRAGRGKAVRSVLDVLLQR